MVEVERPLLCFGEQGSTLFFIGFYEINKFF